MVASSIASKGLPFLHWDDKAFSCQPSTMNLINLNKDEIVYLVIIKIRQKLLVIT
jgi:hypothetical protein